MKIAPDIRSLIEDDIKKLTEAVLSGEVCLSDGRKLTDAGISEGDVHHVSGEVLRFIFERRLLAPVIQYLGTIKWLNLFEAMVYARCGSKNTILKWIEDGKIYGYQPNGEKGDWRVDRESIDGFFNTLRDERRLRFSKKGRRPS